MPIAIGRLIAALGLAVVLVAVAPQRAPAEQRAEISETDRSRVRTPPGPEDRRLPAPAPGTPLPGFADPISPLGGGLDAGPDAGGGELDAGIDGQARPPPPLDDAGCSASGGAGGGMALATFLFATGLGFRQRRLE